MATFNCVLLHYNIVIVCVYRVKGAKLSFISFLNLYNNHRMAWCLYYLGIWCRAGLVGLTKLIKIGWALLTKVSAHSHKHLYAHTHTNTHIFYLLTFTFFQLLLSFLIIFYPGKFAFLWCPYTTVSIMQASLIFSINDTETVFCNQLN